MVHAAAAASAAQAPMLQLHQQPAASRRHIRLLLLALCPQPAISHGSVPPRQKRRDARSHHMRLSFSICLAQR
jgi:hypothetical protein